MAFDPKHKQRDKEKLDRKKRTQREKKQRWRETHGLESDSATLVKSALADACDNTRTPAANPFAGVAARLRTKPKALVAATEQVFLAAVTGDFADGRWHAPLLAVASWKSRWRRSPTDWKPTRFSEALGSQWTPFRSLLYWLFADFEAPPFLTEPFEAIDARPKGTAQQWFIDVAQGGNLRRCAGLPAPLTSRMAHHVVTAPRELSLAAAFRWGQTLGLGGDEYLARVVCQSPLGRRMFDARAETFWREVIALVAREPLFGAGQFGPLVDYLRYAKFGVLPAQDAFDTYGLPYEGRAVEQTVAPPQPNLCVRHRRVRTLLAETDAWHAELDRQHIEGLKSEARWKPLGYDTLIASGEAMWELTTHADLREEGREMRHCIAGYAPACAEGRAVILSYRPTEEAGRSDRLTLHVNPRARTLVEVRGHCNRLPTKQEWRVIGRLAALARIHVSPELKQLTDRTNRW